MPIVETIDYSLFRSRFEDYGRDKDFSYEGLKELYLYFDELAEDCGQSIELDVIAICCDFCEYSDEQLFRDYAPYHGMETPQGKRVTSTNVEDVWNTASEDEMEEMMATLIELLQVHTTVVAVPNGNYIVQGF
jgi:hypothetical protein